MKPIVPNLIGRFGNQLFIYAHARALAEQQNREFRCAPWIGQKIFELDDKPLEPGQDHELIGGYCQNQQSLIYTKRDCQRWFRFKQSIHDVLNRWTQNATLAHIRRGDYFNLGYVVVSKDSYIKAASKFNELPPVFFTEECPMHSDAFEYPEVSFGTDFYAMSHCKVLFRGNSSFSWWAGTIGTAKVYSPVIDGLEGGKEHDCEFVEGNWPKLANLPDITDLHLQP